MNPPPGRRGLRSATGLLRVADVPSGPVPHRKPARCRDRSPESFRPRKEWRGLTFPGVKSHWLSPFPRAPDRPRFGQASARPLVATFLRASSISKLVVRAGQIADVGDPAGHDDVAAKFFLVLFRDKDPAIV